MTKQKGKATWANECNRKHAALKQAATMRATMKNTCDMLFTQAVNLLYETENDPKVERAPYRSMQRAIDFPACHGLAGIQPHPIAYH